MNSRREVDLPLLWSQDLWYRFKGILQWRVMVIISHLLVRIHLGNLSEKQHGSCFYHHLSDFLTFFPLLLITLLL